MLRRRVIFLFAMLVLAGVAVAFVSGGGGKPQVLVSFVNSEASNGRFPDYKKSERLAVDVRNPGSRDSAIDISEIEIEHGLWVPVRGPFEEVKAGQTARYYFYLPQGSHPRSVRMRVHRGASVLEKTEAAIRLLASGRLPVKQVWPARMTTPDHELVVNLSESTGQTNEPTADDLSGN